MDERPPVFEYTEALWLWIIAAGAVVGYFVIGAVLLVALNEDYDAVFDELPWLLSFYQLGGVATFIAGLRFLTVESAVIPAGALAAIAVLLAVGVAGPFDAASLRSALR